MIVASRDFRKLVHARRGHPLAKPRRISGAGEIARAKTAWNSTREHWEEGWKRRSGEIVELEREAGAILAEGELSPATNRFVIAAAERMLNGAATLVGAVAARYGAAEAVRMKWRASAWNVTSGRQQKTWWWMLGDAKPPALVLDAGWRLLRDATCRADDADYADARATAAAFRSAESTPEARVRLDWVFPGEPDWAKQDLDALVVAPTFARMTHAVLPLLGSVADEGSILRLIESLAGQQAGYMASYACDLVVALDEEAATRVLATLAERVLASPARDQAQLREVAVAMNAVRSEAMGRVLARWLRHPGFGRWVASYFEIDPGIASAVLGPISREKSLLADAARSILAANARAAEPDQGSMDDAPAILRDAPWRREPPEPMPLEMLAWKETIAWEPGERERVANAPAVASSTAVIRPITGPELEEFDALPPNQKHVDVWPRWENKRWTILELPDERRLELWDEGKARLYSRAPCWMLARFGERALEGFFARDPFVQWDEDRWVTARLRVDSPRSAMTAARLFARRRIARKRARGWLVAHADAAAAGLVPPALGRESRSRRVALRALRVLAAERPDATLAIATSYGPAAREAIASLLFCDPVARIDVRGLPPKWLRIDALPLLRTRGGRPLPREAAARLVDVLRGRGPDVPYAGIDALRSELDPESFAAFAWALFIIWTLHGGPRTHVWMARALDACPSDETALRLRPYARELARTDARACGVLVDLLAEIDDAPSLLVLAEIAELARTPALRQILAEARGQDADDAISDLASETTLDLGGRVLQIVIDESLAPRVVLPDGRRVAQVPRASKSDDAVRVAAAIERFKRLRSACATTARHEIARLERAMLSSRRWRARDLAARWARHAVVLHLARRIVWGVFSGAELVATFRVAEDGSLADAGDLPFVLEPDASVGVVHPIDLDEGARAAWSGLFGDYEIAQPFEQLGRATFAGTPDEALAITKSLAGVMVSARSLMKTIETQGWHREDRRVASVWRELRGTKPNMHASLSFAPGFDIGVAKTAPLQKLNALTVTSGGLADVDRIELSEIVRTATILRA